MGIEFTGFSLLDVYAKTNPNKITQKYGSELLAKVTFEATEDSDHVHSTRVVEKNPDFTAPELNPEEDAQEEKLLDEQKRFQ